MLTKTVHGSLEVKEIIEDKDKIAKLEETRLTINTNGSVGISSVSPTAELNVK